MLPLPRALSGQILLTIALAVGPAALPAQSCSMPPRALPTHQPWLAQYFFGGTLPNTLNLFFDLDVQTTITVAGFRLPTFDQAQGVGAPEYQVGNLAEARIYLIPGSRSGHEQNRAAWGVTAPASGQPEAIGELLVAFWPDESPLRNFKDGSGTPTSLVIQPGQYGVCIELIPTSWSGTAAIPGQTNVPLLAPGPLHVLGAATGPGAWSDAFLGLDNDGIMQSGWQRVDTNGALVANPTMSNPVGSVNLIVDYVPHVPGLAGWTRYGAGCHTSPRMVYQRFAGATAIDLVDTEWTLAFTQDVSGGRYVIAPGGPVYDSATAIANGIDLMAMAPTVTSSTVPWHDGSRVYTLPIATFPQGFPYPGGSCQDITINANGRVYLGSVTDPVSTFVPHGDATTMQAHPQLMPFTCNLNPEPWSQFRLESPSPNGGVRVTWFNVPSTANPSDFQVELLPTGEVHFAYGSRLANDGSINVAFVGFSAGNGEPVTPWIDWSAITSLQTGSGTVPPTLGLSANPAVGTTLDAVMSRLGPTTLQPIGGFLAIALGSLPTGVPLAVVGLPGCEAHIDLGQLLFLALLPNPGQGDLRWTWTAPVSGNGLQLYLQGGTFTPNVHNTIGFLLSNAVCASIGL